MNDDRIFHITPRCDWEAALEEGVYRTASLTEQGFIHASTLAQVVRTANLFYKGQTGLVLLSIDPQKAAAAIRYEDLAGEGLLFPHIYGALNLDAVDGVADFEPQPDGTFQFPEQFQAVI